MKSLFRKVFVVSAAGVGLLVLPAHAQVAPAATPTPIQPAAATMTAGTESSEDFTVRLGAFFLSSINTKLALSDSAGHGGQEVDLSRDLGIRDSLNVFRLDAEWRFAGKHKVQFAYFDINRSTSHVLTGSINWGDQTYPVNATVSAQFRTTIYKLNYGYTFYQNETNTQEISGLIGFHITGMKASISGAIAGVTSGVEGASITAPLPVFGLEWKSRLSDKLSSYVAYEYFGLSLDNKYTGNLSDFQAMLEYHVGRNWSLGAGYNRYTSRATVTSGQTASGNQLKLALRHDYNGLMLFVSTSF